MRLSLPNFESGGKSTANRTRIPGARARQRTRGGEPKRAAGRRRGGRHTWWCAPRNCGVGGPGGPSPAILVGPDAPSDSSRIRAPRFEGMQAAAEPAPVHGSAGGPAFSAANGPAGGSASPSPTAGPAPGPAALHPPSERPAQRPADRRRKRVSECGAPPIVARAVRPRVATPVALAPSAALRALAAQVQMRSMATTPEDLFVQSAAVCLVGNACGRPDRGARVASAAC